MKYINTKSLRWQFPKRCILPLRNAEEKNATLEELNNARNIVARRRDFLVGGLRRKWSKGRQNEVDRLAEVYNDIVRRMMAMGWN